MNNAWSSFFRDPLETAAPDIAHLLEKRHAGEEATVNLTASETYAPRAALQAESSLLINANAVGYPGNRAVVGNEVIDTIEELAVARAKKLFSAEHANVQSLSATIANVAVLRALLRKGDRILSFDMQSGGHITHGGSTHLSGQDYEVDSFGVDEQGGCIDLQAAESKIRTFRPHMIIAGSAGYPLRVDFEALHELGRAAGALLFGDIAHVAGFVVAGLHPNPVPIFDVVTSCTHKTLCGPRGGGLILCRKEHAAAIDSAVYPGVQGAPGAHVIAARAVLFDVVGQSPFRQLMSAILSNASSLADALREAGIDLYMGGTETHMVMIDLRRSDLSPAQVNTLLSEHGLTANCTTLPFRKGDKSRVGLRLGSVAMTIRGADAPVFHRLGGILARLLRKPAAHGRDVAAATELESIARAHPLPYPAFARASDHCATHGNLKV
jgi:glycine hydroxymethyltransferase